MSLDERKERVGDGGGIEQKEQRMEKMPQTRKGNEKRHGWGGTRAENER